MDGAPISARLIDSDELAIADALTSEEAELLGGRSFWARAFETILRYPLAPEQLELEVLRYLQQYATAVRRDDQEATWRLPRKAKALRRPRPLGRRHVPGAAVLVILSTAQRR